jgi:hypothetical protein
VTVHAHGTYARYATGAGCRCKECKAAKARYVYEKRRRGLPDGDHRHGTRNGFDNFGCRCKACVEAKRTTGRDYYRRTAGAA